MPVDVCPLECRLMANRATDPVRRGRHPPFRPDRKLFYKRIHFLINFITNTLQKVYKDWPNPAVDMLEYFSQDDKRTILLF